MWDGSSSYILQCTSKLVCPTGSGLLGQPGLPLATRERGLGEETVKVSNPRNDAVVTNRAYRVLPIYWVSSSFNSRSNNKASINGLYSSEYSSAVGPISMIYDVANAALSLFPGSPTLQDDTALRAADKNLNTFRYYSLSVAYCNHIYGNIGVSSLPVDPLSSSDNPLRGTFSVGKINSAV